MNVVAERFELLREAGAGGMGVVWEARDRVTGERVAVKVLADRSQEQRFMREGEVLAGLAHEAIVKYVAHDRGWLAMEWLDGEDLGKRIERGALSIDDCVTLATRIVGAIAEAHAQGVVHRDLKPGNVFLVGGDLARAKVLDFGLARDVTQSRRPLTQAGAVMGSIGYLSPEQARGQANVDARSDVFSLGCILFECLTGRVVFSGAHAVAVLAKLLVEDAPRVRSIRADAPRALDDLVARMLERDPAKRPRDASEVLGALAELNLRPTLAPRSTTRTALGSDEQRVMSVILVSERGRESSESMADATMISLRTTDGRETVAQVVAPFDATLDVAAEGTMIITLRGGSTEQATRAAQCALAVHAKCPGTAIALAVGRGVTEGEGLSGEVIERAASLLATALADPADGVHVEKTLAPLLESRFVVTADRLLHAERSAFESARVVLGRVTPFVGRARELGMIENAFAGSLTDLQSSAIVIVGEAGSGKSRLREEAVRSVRRRASNAAVWIVQGDTLRAHTPLSSMAVLVRQLVGASDLRGDDARHALVERVADTVPKGLRDEVAWFLAEMIGAPFDDAGNAQLRAARESKELMQDRITRAWVAFASAELARRPLLLVLEDLHWIDVASVKLASALLAVQRDAPLVVAAFGRPEAQTTFPALWAEHGVQTIRLGPLTPRAAEKLARETLGDRGSDALVAQLVERAAGNPFVLEELMRASAQREDGSLPQGVLALVQARLEALDPVLRRVLRAASIFGRTAREYGIARLLGDEDAIEVVRSSLRTLVQREVLEIERDDASVIRFTHDLVRDAAYAMLTDEDRTTGHALAGAFLEASGEKDAEMLAMHFDLGGETTSAAGWYARAAEQALEGSDVESLRDRVKRALDLGVSGELRSRALYARARSLRWSGDCVAGLADARASIEGFEPGAPAWYSAILEACVLCDAVGERDVCRELVELSLVPTPKDARAFGVRIRILGEGATAAFHAGDEATGDDLVGRIEREAAPYMDDPGVALTVYRMRGVHAAYTGDATGELEQWIQIAGCYAELGDRRLSAIAGVNTGYCQMMLGRYEEAEHALRTVIEEAGEMRLGRAVSAARHNLGLVLACLGDFANAEAEETLAVSELAASKDDRLTAVSRVYLAMILEMAGDLERAEKVAREAIASVTALPPVRPRALAALARVLVRRGLASKHRETLEEAERLSAESIRALETTRIEGGDAYMRVVRVEALLAVDRREEAVEALRSASVALLHAADRIKSAEERERFLSSVPENALTRAFLREYLPSESV
jgi:tetratricopeptide (TPR) repeat protein